jgi:hypothetical protein
MTGDSAFMVVMFGSDVHQNFRFKTDFMRMELLHDGVVVEPLYPGRIPQAMVSFSPPRTLPHSDGDSRTYSAAISGGFSGPRTESTLSAYSWMTRSGCSRSMTPGLISYIQR